MSSNSNQPWTLETFRNKKIKIPCSSSLTMRQKRAEFKSVQKLVDFQQERENADNSNCSKLPTPRSFHTPKPRLNIALKCKLLCSKNLLDRFESNGTKKINPKKHSAVVDVPTPRLPPNPNPLDIMPYEDDDIWEDRNL